MKATGIVRRIDELGRAKFIDMDFDNCINKFNKNDLSLDNLSFECRAVICENFHDVYSVR